MQKLIFRNNLGIFSRLLNLGVKNFFTYDNEKWGSARYTENPKFLPNLRRIFKYQGVLKEHYIHLMSSHNDEVQILTKGNLEAYKIFCQDEVAGPLKPVLVYTDSLITKVKIPIVIATADCAIVVLTGIDKKDSKRFVIFSHLGIAGVLLNLIAKSIDTAKTVYKFKNSDLEAFVFPYLVRDNYKKEREEIKFKELLKGYEGVKFIEVSGNMVDIYLGRKVQDELKKLGVKSISQTGLDTLEEHKKGKLFSHTYSYFKKKDKGKRFAVGVSL